MLLVEAEGGRMYGPIGRLSNLAERVVDLEGNVSDHDGFGRREGRGLNNGTLCRRVVFSVWEAMPVGGEERVSEDLSAVARVLVEEPRR